MNKLIVNCQTGESTFTAMSAEEVAALEAERAAYVEPEAPTDPAPKDTPAEALAHALMLSVAAPKPMTEIMLNLMVVIEDMDRQIKLLK